MRHLTKGKGDSEREHKPASNRVCPHVASPHEGRIVSCSILGYVAILPHLPVIFPPRGKVAEGDYEGWQVAYIGA